MSSHLFWELKSWDQAMLSFTCLHMFAYACILFCMYLHNICRAPLMSPETLLSQVPSLDSRKPRCLGGVLHWTDGETSAEAQARGGQGGGAQPLPTVVPTPSLCLGLGQVRRRRGGSEALKSSPVILSPPSLAAGASQQLRALEGHINVHSDRKCTRGVPNQEEWSCFQDKKGFAVKSEKLRCVLKTQH